MDYEGSTKEISGSFLFIFADILNFHCFFLEVDSPDRTSNIPIDSDATEVPQINHIDALFDPIIGKGTC